jgi:hypothetical protein
MNIGRGMTDFSLKHYRLVTGVMVAVTLAIMVAAALPSLHQIDAMPEWIKGPSRSAAKALPQITVDTDPENMLSEDEPVRIFHDEMKQRMTLNDIIVVGVVNEQAEHGVFNPRSLGRIYELTQFAEVLKFDETGELTIRSQDDEEASSQDTPVESSGPSLPGGLPGGESSDGPALPGGLGGEDTPAPPMATPERMEVRGVIRGDIIAPSKVDNIQPKGGAISFEYLMAQPPETSAEALAILDNARRVHFLDGTLVSDDGRAVAVYLPITAKKYSYPIYNELNNRIPILWTWADLAADIRASDLGIATQRDLIKQGRKLAWLAESRDAFATEITAMIEARGDSSLRNKATGLLHADPMDDGDAYHITGLPVAEDTFGVQMFMQMAISAPAAMGVIFILMLLFFRKLTLIISPMIVAMVSVIFTMGSLIIAGFPIHIMSSMIPIFIMPIAVLDSIHIISDFFEKYQQTKDREKTMRAVMDELFVPMLYTSLTSAAGFASLALTPIPPVQVFGVFVAAGILVAWLLTVMFIPAFVMFLSEKRLANFGRKQTSPPLGEKASLRASGGHEGTPSGQKAISPKGGEVDAHGWLGKVLSAIGGVTYRRAKIIVAVSLVILAVAGVGIAKIKVNDNPVKWFDEGHPIRIADDVLNKHFGGTYMAYLAMEYDGDEQVFKRPDVLRWQRSLQDAMQQVKGEDGRPLVGKSNSLADIVKTVHQNFMADDLGDPNYDALYRIPDTPQAVAQMILQFQQSHRPNDIDKFVTPNYRTASTWVQLKSGNNRDMETLARSVEKWVAENPPPVPLETKWFGLTYINVVWQDKMVVGMLQAFAGSFLVVFLLMTILFRSGLWGLLSMVPLTVTIAAIYGGVGWVGKDYDMPVAVLSSLTLGLAVDFAIHFLARSREMVREQGSWEKAAPLVFAEPAKAISRNIIVIAAGFTPLLLAPLVPYQTVGILLATILLVSGVATLLLLPALLRLLGPRLFKPEHKTLPASCNCGFCAIISTTAAVLLALNFYAAFGWGVLTWIAIGAIPVMALACGQISRRIKCKTIKNDNANTNNTNQ